MNRQQNPASVLIAVAIIIGVFVWVGNQQQKSAQLAKEAFGDSKPEEVLAMLDTKQKPPDPKDVQRYANVLDQLEEKCLETREEIAVMSAGLTKSSINAGVEKADNFEAHLNSLKTILDMAQGFTDRRGRPSSGNCIQMIQGMINDNKQAQKEKAEEEEDAAQKRQQEREQQGQPQSQN